MSLGKNSKPVSSNSAMPIPAPRNMAEIRYASVLIPKNSSTPVTIAIKGA